MSQFEIEKCIPLPPPDRGGRMAKYPWRSMDVGDSFYVPVSAYKPRNGKATINNLQGCLNGASGGYKPMNFATRREGDGVRVWRTA